MVGTDKQIAWATDIANKWIMELNHERDCANDRVARNNMPTVWGEIVAAQVDKTIKAINSMSAKQIIDNRNFRAASVVMDACGKAYDKAMGVAA